VLTYVFNLGCGYFYGKFGPMNDIYEERDWVDTTAAFAPAVLGAAAWNSGF
jgi:hypothetical protein